MKSLIFTFAVIFFGFVDLTQAETTGLFPSQKKGIVLIQNGESADADFFWNIFSVESVVSGSRQTKSFESVSGDFKVSARQNTKDSA